MRDLNYDLKQLCRRNRDGSYATQADREHILDLIADQLDEMGFRHMNAHSLKPKHVEKLVERWLAENLSPGTIKNRMSALRWWAQKTGKENIIARTNAAYGIPDRVYVTNLSKAKELAMDQLEQIRTLCIRISLRLQSAFGLRREESIKIVPKWADRGDSLVLKDSWTKGGREREIPIRTLEQRQIVDDARVLAKGKSLVGARLYDLPRLSAALPRRVRTGRDSRLPWASPLLRPGALQGTDRLGVPSPRWPDVEATHGEACFANAGELTSACRKALPTDLAMALSSLYGNWKVADVDDLTPDDQTAWKKHYPEMCPGLPESPGIDAAKAQAT